MEKIRSEQSKGYDFRPNWKNNDKPRKRKLVKTFLSVYKVCLRKQIELTYNEHTQYDLQYRNSFQNSTFDRRSWNWTNKTSCITVLELAEMFM